MESTIQSRLERKKISGVSFIGSERPTVFSKEIENQLATCIKKMCSVGFSPTINEVKKLVQEYVKDHNISTPFTNNMPGKAWFNGFMSRNKISLKKANLICSVRKSVTANPFIIYDFYDKLETIVKENNFTAEQIWNCDESGFPSDPQKCKVVSGRGKVAYKITCGVRRDNTTVLAVCNAAGKALDPLIVFTGKSFQRTWRGANALPNMYYSVSEIGWMTSDIFFHWFTKFTKEITTCPLLLIFDGHLSQALETSTPCH